MPMWMQEARNLQKYGEIPESVKVNETTEGPDDQNEDIVFGSDSELDDIDEVQCCGCPAL